MEKIHKIQIAILARLRAQSPARYGYLKPQKVEGNVFVYHLKTLIKQGIVEKVADGYALTRAGKHYVDGLREDGLGIRIQPRIVTLIVICRSDGACLLYRRDQEPYRDLIGFPYGKIHLGEKIAESAARVCRDKVGLEVPLVHAGDAYVGIKYDKSGQIDSDEFRMHTLFHVFVGNIGTQEPMVHEDVFWKSPHEVSREEQIPGFKEIAHLVDQWSKHEAPPSQRFFDEFWLER